MPKSPVQVFWRGASGRECVLRSTDEGWEVAVLADGGGDVKRTRVSGAQTAKQIAERWRVEDGTEADAAAGGTSPAAPDARIGRAARTRRAGQR